MKKEDIEKLENLNKTLIRIENYQTINRTMQFAFINFLWVFILIIGWFGTMYSMYFWRFFFGIVVMIIWWILIAVLVTMIGYKLYMPYLEYDVILANKKFKWKSKIKKYVRLQSNLWMLFYIITVFGIVLSYFIFNTLIIIPVVLLTLIFTTFAIYISGSIIFGNWKKSPLHLIIPIFLLFILQPALFLIYWSFVLWYIIFAICVLYIGGELFGLYFYYYKEIIDDKMLKK